MRNLEKSLALLVEETLGAETEGLPPQWRARLSQAIPFREFRNVSLVSCASSQWCGAPPETGLPGAAAVLFLAGAAAVHSLDPVGAALPGIEGYDGGGDPTAARILAGDALIPMAAGTLCRHVPSACISLTGMLMKTAGGILEAMNDGNRPDPAAGEWVARLASLAAGMGAVSAGAGPDGIRKAESAGFLLGLASALPGEAFLEAERMLREALDSLGGGSPLFREIAGLIAARGTGEEAPLS